jgi:hypothetical protein
MKCGHDLLSNQKIYLQEHIPIIAELVNFMKMFFSFTTTLLTKWTVREGRNGTMYWLIISSNIFAYNGKVSYDSELNNLILLNLFQIQNVGLGQYNNKKHFFQE